MLEFPAGCYRVNGRLAVSRAIGDYGLKDVVIGEPDIVAIPLNGNEGKIKYLHMYNDEKKTNRAMTH